MKSRNIKKYMVWLSVTSLMFAAVLIAPKAIAQTSDTSSDNNGSSNTNNTGNTNNGTTIVPVPVSYNNGLDLGQLLIYDQLFRNSNSTVGGFRARNLGDLVLMSNLFGGNGGSILSNGYSGNTTLGTGNMTGNLGNLFVLDRLFGTNVGHSSIFTGSPGNLGDLYLMNQLFNK